MKRIHCVMLGLAAFATFSTSASAMVMTLNDAPQSFAISKTVGAATLVVTGTIDITSLSSTSMTLHVRLNNDSTLSGARLTAWGFGITPNASSVVFVDTSDGGMVGGGLGSLPGQPGIEVCTRAGPNNCNGGGNGGIVAGSFDEFDLTLTGNWGNDEAQIAVDAFGVKMQGASGGLYDLSCTANCGSDVTPLNGRNGNAPEPQSFLLAAVGLLSLAFLRRRQTA